MVQLNFDASQHAPLDNDPLPEGWYNFIIDESSAAPTKDGNPNHLRLNLRASVIEGQHKGRKVFIGLNIRHTNIQTMEIANRELSSIAAAVKLPYIQDTQQLHNIPFKGRVKITKDANGVYDDRAELKSYKPIDFIPPASNSFVPPLAPSVSAAQSAPQQAPQGWAPQQAPQQQFAPNPAAPQQMPQQPPNGGWQQPQQAQPWSQPQQAAPQVQQAPQQATPLPPVQFAPNPQQAAPQQAAPQGFAAPTQQPAPQQAPQAAPQPQDPAVAAAQQASPPWAKQG